MTLIFAATITLGASVSQCGAQASPSSTSFNPLRGPTDSQRMEFAHNEAVRLLNLAKSPPSSSRIPTWIHLKGYQLSQPMSTIASPNLVDLVHFFVQSARVSSSGWISGYLPKRATLQGTGSSSSGMTKWSYGFAGGPVLSPATLEYTSLTLPDGRVEWRIDAQVVWKPQKPLVAFVPNGAVKVVARLTDSRASGSFVEPRATTTERSMVRRIGAAVDALPVIVPGAHSCPFDDGKQLNLRFFRAKASTPMTSIVAQSSGCETVTIRQYGLRGRVIGIANLGGGRGFTSLVARLLGLHSLS